MIGAGDGERERVRREGESCLRYWTLTSEGEGRDIGLQGEGEGEGDREVEGEGVGGKKEERAEEREDQGELASSAALQTRAEHRRYKTGIPMTYHPSLHSLESRLSYLPTFLPACEAAGRCAGRERCRQGSQVGGYY